MPKPVDSKMMLPPDIVAAICDVAPQTMITWRKRNVGPPFDEVLKMYPARALGEWLSRERPFMQGKGGGYPYLPDPSRFPTGFVLSGDDGAGQVLTKEQEEVRYKRAQADEKELDIAERAGQLVKADDVTMAWIDIVSRVKTRLTRIPSALAPLVHGKKDVYDIQATLESGIREALDELSDDWRDTKEEPDEDDG